MPTSEENKYNYQCKNKKLGEMNNSYKEDFKHVGNEDKTSCSNCKKEITLLRSEIEKNRLDMDRSRSKVEKIEKVGKFGLEYFPINERIW